MNMIKKPSLKQWWALVKGAASAWSDDYAPSMGAALSYYSVFSLAPLLLIVISIAGLVFGQDAAHGEIFGQLRGLMGDDAAKAVEGILSSVSKPPQGISATAIGIVILLIGATTVFGELQDALDRIWRAPARDKSSGLWGLLRARLLSFGMVLGIAFLLMVSLVLSAAVSALGKWWGGVFGGWEVLAQLVNALVGFALTSGVFAMIYKLMPRVTVRWHDVWLGSVVTALLFTVGQFLIGLYIGKSAVASGFGAAGSLIIIFVWVYYSAQIFLMGAEFTWIYAETFGSRRPLPITPNPGPAAEIFDATGGDEPQLPASRQEAPSPLPSEPAADTPSLAGVGVAIAAVVTIRYLLPKLLRGGRGRK